MKLLSIISLLGAVLAGTLIVEGCKPSFPGTTFTESVRDCLKTSLGGIVESPSVVVDYIIQDSNWYKDTSDNVCADSLNTPECWISSLLFLLDRHSPIYHATAKCICKVSGTCEPLQVSNDEAMTATASPDERCTPPEKRPVSLTKMRFSSCITQEIAVMRPEYMASGSMSGSSITNFLHDHYTYCRSNLTLRFSFAQRMTFQVLYIDSACPRHVSEEHWRETVLGVYEDATRRDSPIWGAINTCRRKIYSNVDPCTATTCQANSRCVQINGFAICECNEGYSPANGGSCQATDPCSAKNCPPLERCFAYRRRAYCLCQAGDVRGTSGKCENPCKPNPCQNGGICSRSRSVGSGISNVKCTCRPPYSGNMCQVDSTAKCTTPCHRDATCRSISRGNFQCRCDAGYDGDGIRCDKQDLNPCKTRLGSSCHEMAKCQNAPGGYRCICKDGFKGDGFECTAMGDCERKYGRRCGTNARCATTPSGGYSCECMHGYIGDGFTCRGSTDRGGIEKYCLQIKSTDANRAVSDPDWFKNFVDDLKVDLQNIWKTFSGFMRAEFRGEYQTKPDGRVQATLTVNVWVSQTQRGGRTDIKDLVRHFVQSSANKAKFSGVPTSCGAELVDGCHKLFGRKCGNFATCVNTAVGGYRCVCDSGYQGDGFDCRQTAVFPDPCLRNPCQNGGVCEVTMTSYQCRCKIGFSGVNCQNRPKCPGNKVYTECASRCRDSCSVKHDICTEDCDTEVFCVCPRGMVERRPGIHRCVRKEDCPEKRERRAVCRAWGDPHYYTFDKSGRHDFMGKCSYVMSETKGIATTDDRWFRVVAENEVRYNVTEVSYVKEPTIYLNGGRTVIVLQKDGIVTVNGAIITEADGPLYEITRSGKTLVLTTIHDVCVSFNGDALHIKVPKIYKSMLKGLCGNYNDNAGDDLIMDNGVMAGDYDEFAVSHQFGVCDKPLPPPITCSESDKRKWSGPEFCGMFRTLRGSFTDCSIMIDSNVYFDACLFDICATGGNMDALEQNLEQYVSDCKDNGIDICDWRRTTGRKEFSCPAHSTYNGCASTCYNTCANPSAVANCQDTTTEETCVCDVGYVRDGNRCVLSSDCGCVRDFLYYSIGQLSDTESTTCVCEGPNRFKCVCKTGYELVGAQCRLVVDPCTSAPCMNDGTCSSSGRQYSCTCMFGYSGANCERRDDPCTSAPCMNGGTCVSSGRQYSCTCMFGYSGVNCERRDVVDPCTSAPCMNGGTCASSGQQYSCTCMFGYFGVNCERRDDPCRSAPCMNGGTCASSGQQYSCTCMFGYSGVNCERRDVIYPCMSVLCMNGGICTASGRQHSCRCVSGYSGADCEIDPNPCFSSPCLNGGACISNSNTGSSIRYTCSCTGGYTGMRCERRFTNQCDTNPCRNGGVCLVQEDTYKCECPEGYLGKNCQRPPKCPGNKVYTSCGKGCIDSCERQHQFCAAVCDPEINCVCPTGMVERKPGWNRCIPIHKCPKSRVTRAVCRAWGDPHFHLFDTSVGYMFQGACQYVMAETKGIRTDDSRWFRVVAQNERRYGETDVSWLKEVIVYLDGGATKITLGKKRVAMMNGNEILEADSDTFEISRSGNNIVLTTEHDVAITFNGNGMRIKIPQDYKNQIKGLCGNFNGNPGDDLIMENGMLASDYTEFAMSHQFGDCDNTTAPKFVCQESDKTKWSDVANCGMLMEGSGVFSACHSAVSAKIYFDSCVVDVCATDGNRAVLEDAYVEYINSCKEQGVGLCDWRRRAGVSQLRCPQFSTYNGCASPCQDTCLRPQASETCDDQTTVEACVCNIGYVREGDRCVQQSQCGCVENGLYYRKGQQISNDAQVCTCVDRNSFKCNCKSGYDRVRNQCQKKTHSGETIGQYCLEFKSTEVTQVVNDQGWFNRFVDDLTKDLETILRNFNGFVRAEFGAQARGMPNGKVQVTLRVTVWVDLTSRQGPVRVEDVIRHYVQSSARKVRFSGAPIECGTITTIDACMAMSCGQHASCKVISGRGQCVCEDGYVGDGVTCNPSPKGPCQINFAEMMSMLSKDFVPQCDLLGNYKTRQCNSETGTCYCVDKLTGITIDWTELAEEGFSWNCDQLPNTCRYRRARAMASQRQDDVIPTCDENGNYHSWQCYSMTGMCSCVDKMTGSIVEGTTRAMGGDPVNCDRSVFSDHTTAKYCLQIKSAEASQAINDPNWFNVFVNELTTDLNSIWRSFSGFMRAEFRAEYQMKPDGKVQATLTVNVWIDLTKTRDDVRIRDLIRHFVESSARKTRFEGVPSECDTQEELTKDPCRDRLGQKCHKHAICLMDSDGYACVCKDGYSGDGFKCNRRSEWRGVCRVWGDPHHQTFDRGEVHDFQGMCTYLMSEARLPQTDRRWFRVVAENEMRDNITAVSYVKLVTVSLFDEFGEEFVIMILKDGTVLVNGNNVIEAETPMFSIERKGRGVVVTTSDEVCISFNGDAMRIKLPENYKSQVMGLCGNYNGDPSDDLMMENGEMAADYNELAVSYQFGSCDVPLPPPVVCKDSDRRKWSGQTYCGMLKEANGGFRDCLGTVNSQIYFDTCVFDLCATNGDTRLLKPVLEEYVADCQDNDVDMCKWRATFGGKQFDCPAHSKYNGCASPCQNTCLNPMASADCDETNTLEDCVCDEGYVRDGTRCARLSECGCVHDSMYYKKGEVVYFDSQICTCERRNDFKCRCRPGFEMDAGVCKIMFRKGTCAFQRAELIAVGNPDTFIPECDPDGNYKAKQCYEFVGQCFCVHKRTGVTLEGTTMDGLVFKLNCDRLPVNCQFINAMRLAEGNLGDFIPVCDEDGNYNTEQCDDEGMCYCVDKMKGVEIEGTKAMLAEFKLDCDTIPKNFGRCRKQHGKQCHKHATCKVAAGGYNCVCNAGYSGNGFNCQGQNDCEKSFGRKCHRNAECRRGSSGDYGCRCKAGYDGNGFSCRDIAGRCRQLHGRRCHRHATCTAVSRSSYDCVCNSGYKGTGLRCNLISECQKLSGVPCHANALCQRFEGSYRCNCRATYQGDGLMCVKVDKCQEQFGRPCDRNADCGRNSHGSVCRCKDGYVGTGLECRVMSECHKRLKQPCHENAMCRRVSGQYRCVCVAGYRGDGMACQKISQCEQSTGEKCHKDADCVRNDMGAYECRCMEGYWGNGYFCGGGDPPDDPCHRRFGRMCHSDATCEMMGGGEYHCKCQEGYIGDGYECQEMDRRLCFENLGQPCAINARCTRRNDNYMCICRSGYFGAGFYCDSGVWSNECHRQFGRRCARNAQCDVMTGGQYTCNCAEGYRGDGHNCQPRPTQPPQPPQPGQTDFPQPRPPQPPQPGQSAIRDRFPCFFRSGQFCDQHATCARFNGGQYECRCWRGFFGNGFHCTNQPIDRCQRRFGRRCHQNAECRRGDNKNYECQCKNGFFGDGYFCQADPRDQCERRFGQRCSQNAQCQSGTGGREQCVCNSGYTGNGFLCQAESECHRRYGIECHVHAGCEEEGDNFYTCQCRGDYVGDGFNCRERSGCHKQLRNSCHQNAFCLDTGDGYQCHCRNGFDGNGFTACDEVFCQRPSDINQGTVAPSLGKYFVGDVITYVCQARHKLVGVPTRTCMANRAFNGVPPRCVRDDKQGQFGRALPTSQFGEPGQYQDECHRFYSMPCSPNGVCIALLTQCVCEDGYVGDGFKCQSLTERGSCSTRFSQDCHPNADCRADMFSNHQCECRRGYVGDGFQCDGLTCQRPADIENGRVVDTEGIYSVNHVVTYQCNGGYRIMGNTGRTCTADGTWTGQQPHCEITDNCFTRFAQPCHHEADCITSEGGGYVCVCKEGYTGDGNDCRAAGCQRPQDIDHGRVLSTQGTFTVGNVIAYQCDDGYRVVGDGLRTCQEDGQWTGSQPSCQAGQPDGTSHGMQSTQSGQPAQPGDCARQFGDRCSDFADCFNVGGGQFECRCRSGYTGNGFDCQDDPRHHCERRYGQKCSQHASCQWGIIGTEQCVCNDGYTGNGFLCQAQETGQVGGVDSHDGSSRQPDMQPGQVDHIPDQPTQQDCQTKFGKPCHHFADCRFDVGGHFECRCRDGYSGSGFDCIAGQPDGTSHGMQSTQSGQPAQPGDCARQFGDRCSDFADCFNVGGGQFECRCRSGYTGNGFDCQDHCEMRYGKKCSQHASCQWGIIGTEKCVCNDGYTGNGFLCQAQSERHHCEKRYGKKCSQHASCQWGIIGTEQCVCNDGYTGNGFICQEVGKAETRCQRPVDISFGNMEFTDGTYQRNTVVTYTCQDGYELMGNTRRTCQDNGQWSGSQPRCEQSRSRTCSTPQNLHNGRFRASDPQYGDNSRVTYSCDGGYFLRGDSQRVCQSGVWSGRQPQCVRQ